MFGFNDSTAVTNDESNNDDDFYHQSDYFKTS